MPFVVSPEQVMKANEFRELMAAYNDIEDLVSIGAYKRGTKPIGDRAIDSQVAINRYLRQDKAEFSSYEEAQLGVTQAIAPALT